MEDWRADNALVIQALRNFLDCDRRRPIPVKSLGVNMGIANRYMTVQRRDTEAQRLNSAYSSSSGRPSGISGCYTAGLLRDNRG